ncbi:hypothetical protein C427_4263 [Paraglaciecola psychrophila 170]|uniref:Uncharacterized protein n=1 Tax=Paraglaciecola psychrophila 170 TaxID=1129794 RepID=M4RUN3_9ALTE|nr:hypothetical protein C427_4263 [Paraglaciecola psychrophila 170]
MPGVFTTALASPKGARHGSLKYAHVVLCADKDLAENWLEETVTIYRQRLYDIS